MSKEINTNKEQTRQPHYKYKTGFNFQSCSNVFSKENLIGKSFCKDANGWILF